MIQKIKRMSTVYKNYTIEYNLYGQNEYTVQYCGDDFFFKTERDAVNFIDSLDK